MRLFKTALASLVLTVNTAVDAADDVTMSDGATTHDDAERKVSFDAERKDTNSANDPTEPKLAVENWNYYAPSLNNLTAVPITVKPGF
jgi:hypothetical protein